jgi:outer membrane protein assembly factor BamE (lipoprotein component of BamABCDE complex)
VIATLTVLAIPAALLAAAWVLAMSVFGSDGPPDCDSYSFDREAWRNDEGDAREQEAAALVGCGTLNGMPGSEVRDLLGDPSPRPTPAPDRWTYAAGWVNDAIGVGDGQTLFVRFDANGRVKGTNLAYPPRDYE